MSNEGDYTLTEGDKKNDAFYQSLLKNDVWYEENKGKYVLIAGEKIIKVDLDEETIFKLAGEDKYHKQDQLIMLIDRNPEPLPVPSDMFE